MRCWSYSRLWVKFSLFEALPLAPALQECVLSLALSQRGIESRNVRRGRLTLRLAAFRPSSRMVLKSSAPSSPKSDSIYLYLLVSPLRSVFCTPLRSVVRSSVDRIDLVVLKAKFNDVTQLICHGFNQILRHRH